MILPSDSRCREVLDDLEDEPELNSFEHEFIESNSFRQEFTTAQKEVVARMIAKYDV